MIIARIALLLLLGVLIVVGVWYGINSGDDTPRFGVYLAPNMSYSDITQFNLSHIGDITLQEEPVITEEDIVWYNWSEQTMQLTETGCLHLQESLLESSWLYVPFVVVADGERIYLGGFLSVASSFASDCCPYIMYGQPIDLCNASSGIVAIRQGFYDAMNGSDIRYDERIYEALDSTGKLVQ